ncbi:hypothetical protein MBANPS3_009639 [Mucor bainieri]
MTDSQATKAYLSTTSPDNWNFNVAIDLVKAENSFNNEQAFSKLDLILAAYNNHKSQYWKKNWKSMIKAYDKSVNKESNSSRTAIGTQVNTTIGAVNARQFRRLTKRFVSFMVPISATTASIANEATSSTAADEYILDDPFAEESPGIPPLVTKSRMREWKQKATYQPKLHLQDLMFYDIADFTSSNSKDGTHYVYDNKLAIEKSLHKVEHKERKEIAHYARELLKSSSRVATLKERLKSNKHKASDDDDHHTVLKICKVYVKLHDEEICLYNTDVNETTYLMCYIRPLFIHLLRSLYLHQFQWAEAALRCKKTHENKILKDDGACTTPTRIDGIITDKDFNLEVAVIEISGPNNKVDTTHFLEDKKKTAKNLKYMYEAIMSLKSKPSLESKMSLKVYGFHVYMNTLHVYSLKQPTLKGPYIFQQELAIELVNSKVVVPLLPTLISQLWLIRDVLEQQHQQLTNFIYDDDLTPATSTSASDQEEPYISPRKKQKAKHN